MTDADSKFSRDEWVAKVEALLATAESLEKTNPDGAASYRLKAEQLMNRFRVEEEELRTVTGVSLEPVKLEVRLCAYGSPYRKQYQLMFGSAVHHAGCQGEYRYRDGSMVGTIVGFDIDTKYAQLLFLNASVVFAAHLEPAFNPDESEAENIYRLRRSGMTRREIAVRLWGIEVDHS